MRKKESEIRKREKVKKRGRERQRQSGEHHTSDGMVSTAVFAA
jgi:hypothetical protein